ncbi:hypothetical protein LO763_11625 [Glycomyces sp. A-F 0318]|uniref:hypothetical protein n=1 Tax=Glycomyces amatae TaxID=2881355 RepID=UPI001E4CAE64|nr:hypothetical protein [Glycomyces amatae]MCD0444271.1 hypothetical protein [Glycomyces amatae]
MDTLDIHTPATAVLGTTPLGTIRRNNRSLRLSLGKAEPGQWCIRVDVIATDTHLGVVVVTPGWNPAPIWEPAAGLIGILYGVPVETSIVETCEAFAAAVSNGVPLDARHGLRLDPACPYPIPMHEQEGVAWAA